MDRGGGERHRVGGNSAVIIKAGGEETGGSFFLSETTGVTHTFINTSDAPVRFLNFNTPAGWENYMRDLGAAAKSGPLTPEVIGRVAARYDFHAV